jgi:hypothetical protein
LMTVNPPPAWLMPVALVDCVIKLENRKKTFRFGALWCCCWEIIEFLFFHGRTAPSGSGRPHYRGFTITLRHTTLGRTPLDEWSAWRRDLYPTTHNNNNRKI